MTANYTKVRTHAKLSELLMNFSKIPRPDLIYWDPASVKLSFVVLELTCS